MGRTNPQTETQTETDEIEIETTGGAFKAAIESLGLARRNAENRAYPRDDYSDLIGVINTRDGDTIEVSDHDIDVLWDAMALRHFDVGNTPRDTRRFEDALAGAENVADDADDERGELVTDGGEDVDDQERDPVRHEAEFRLSQVVVGDRIDPLMIPSHQDVDVGDAVHDHVVGRPAGYSGTDDDDRDPREYTVRLIAHGYSDRFHDVQNALVYDPQDDLFARLSGHTRGGAMNQTERDWTVRDVGRDIVVTDQWDVSIPDLDDFGETEDEFVDEWVDILFGELRHGADLVTEMEQLDGATFALHDYDARRATVQYELQGGDGR